MDTARILTDAGPAFIKAMGNRQGPHALACELVGTQLAKWLGLPTFDFAILTIDSVLDEIPFKRGGKAASGPAFVTRAVENQSWGGSEKELKRLVNPEAIARLVVFDTWTLNADRYPPDLSTRRQNLDNVFLEKQLGPPKGKLRLIAMDHSHCFTSGGELSRKLAHVGQVKDERIYGLFPAFRQFVHQDGVDSALERLCQFSQADALEIMQTIPNEWEVNSQAISAWVEFLCQRAKFLADSFDERIGKLCWPGRLFDK